MHFIAIAAPVAVVAFLVSRFARNRAVRGAGNTIFVTLAVASIAIGLLSGAF